VKTPKLIPIVGGPADGGGGFELPPGKRINIGGHLYEFDGRALRHVGRAGKNGGGE
jgi:hypothetical protein